MTVTEGRADTLTDGRLVTKELAEWVSGLRFEDLPDEVVAEAGRTKFMACSRFRISTA